MKDEDIENYDMIVKGEERMKEKKKKKERRKIENNTYKAYL